jgi:hypothetical protein
MNRYPNLTAEYKATEYDITTLAQHTNVTVDVMRDILSGKDGVSLSEAQGLTVLFSCSAEYLFNNTLTMATEEEHHISEYKALAEKLLLQLKYMGLTSDTYTKQTINKARRFLKKPTITLAELNEAKACMEHIKYTIGKAKKPPRAIRLYIYEQA